MSRNRTFLLIGLAVALVIAGVISFYASSSPDGLEYTAGEKGFLDSARDSGTAGSPLADYGVAGVDNERLSVGLAGIIGVLIVLLLATLLTTVLKGRRTREDTEQNATSDTRSDS
jgi:cobalt/nickel transport system permease protein/cobalt/nickel transport protein